MESYRIEDIPVTKAQFQQYEKLGERARKEFLKDLKAIKNIAMPAPIKSAGSVEATLAERGNRYGDFTDHAKIAQDLQDVMRRAVEHIDAGVIGVNPVPAWNKLSPVQKQALTVIADKIARILSGDPDYADNWHDIQGYAKLVEDRLPKETK